ncbi:MAG TPA: 2-oxoacid:acceptor oxidoreductase family protein, partial [Methanofastidiosum sp.]|nr:2-oxoacid:acceptor oxidoreductase family protein [Methanofastidiosum sp.]
MKAGIRISGFGGQGIILSGVIVGKAAVNQGFNAVQTQSYGPEARGGSTRSEVVISDEEIDYPKVES